MVSWAVRPIIELVPDTPVAIRVTRRALRAATDIWCRPHPAAVIVPVRAETPHGVEVRGEWVVLPDRAPDGRPPGEPDLTAGAVLYVHGSGYAVASARTHRAITSRLAVRTARPVFACDYRLAPAHRFPAAADDVAAAFDWLVAQGVDATRVVVAGDSAGGQLGLALAAERSSRGEGPAGVLLLSPLVDVTLSHAQRWESAGRRDPLVSVARVRRLLALYLEGADPSSPALRLAGDALRTLPPLQVHVSATELLSDDSRHLVRSVVAAGGRAELLEWPGQMHVFQALAGFVPEATRSLRAAAAFVRARLDDTHVPSPTPTPTATPTPTPTGGRP